MLAVGTLRSPRAMTPIFLATMCFLACVLLLIVLFQWTRDTKRKTTTRAAVDDAAGETGERKRPQVIGRERANGKDDRFKGRSHGCGPGCNECERVVYERLVNSMKPGKES